MTVRTAPNGADETEPLLPGVNTPTRPINSQAKKFMILLMCGIFVLAADFGNDLGLAPQTEIFEQIICRKHEVNSSGAKDPSWGNPCKSEAVQGELALVLGYKDMFEVLPSILLSLPYGILSDHWGRKPVIYLGVVGMLVGEIWVRLVALWSGVLPLRLVWLTGLFRVIGGGDQVVVSIALVMVADIFDEEERSTALFRLQSCITLAEVMATPVSAFLMGYSIWLPYILGLVVMVIGSIPILFLPETLEEAKAKKRASRLRSGTESPMVSSEPADLTGKPAVVQDLIRQIEEFKNSTRFIWRDRNIWLLVLCLFVTVMTRQTNNVLLQYVSKKFDWSIAQASLLISLRGFFALANYLVIMPGLTFILAKYCNLHGKLRDRSMSQGSGIFSIIGFLAVGFAPVPSLLICGMVFMSMGSAFHITLRSLGTGLVSPVHVGTLYSAMTISISLGLFIAGPLFAYLFRLGMHFGGPWMGLPFLQGGLFFVMAVVAVSYIRVRRPSSFSGQSEEEEPLLS
ncbi:hypothetical protein N7462_006119 [Penicillium macrosclerotiorum]|uniref:uncharacterized protein n=1 Tax=Penicillium macrosclerotiorum TaxID=303699 RepID=UPI002547FABE|nr:uncharacterized protein N7462_006119 [Penicillium macrosclerotiorum]KAJ5682954.1 hypothetical protein N7462_006119 [Penicillium macrosclerotiorum]